VGLDIETSAGATISGSFLADECAQQKFLTSSTKQSQAAVPGRLCNILPAVIPER